ncbi:hypothetical protein L484_015504 [Morus notabilis]|uniref:F-box domain-containing protein n=1 Tax=Morus notabilis TaxID=981085 RepID=W9RUK0_9ROSA|nr:hypothetical protein L484_015504 [Morus notabilis]
MAKTLLPWEIIVDIISRLSVKDLLRYSKWCSLIDGPDFIKLYLINHSKRPNFNVGHNSLQQQHLLRPESLQSRNDVVLWNPSTRSTKANSWKMNKKTGTYFLIAFLPSNGSGVAFFSRNALHWLVLQKSSSESEFSSSEVTLALNLVTEEYREIPQQECTEKYEGNIEIFASVFEISLAVLGGSLCCVRSYVESPYSSDFLVHRVDVWVMKQYGVKESWRIFGANERYWN